MADKLEEYMRLRAEYMTAVSELMGVARVMARVVLPLTEDWALSSRAEGTDLPRPRQAAEPGHYRFDVTHWKPVGEVSWMLARAEGAWRAFNAYYDSLSMQEQSCLESPQQVHEAVSEEGSLSRQMARRPG